MAIIEYNLSWDGHFEENLMFAFENGFLSYLQIIYQNSNHGGCKGMFQNDY